MKNHDFPAWLLLGQYPQGDDDGVGSWILHHGGEAALLELHAGPAESADCV